METDYTSWSNADLVKRVSELEAQLRAQNTLHSTPLRASSLEAKKKPKKAPKPFDPNRYTFRKIALKFAYLGGNYNGYEHHTNNITPLPTIEETLWRALRKTRLIFPTYKPGQNEEDVNWEGCEYSKCGRTDRGVSAFGQVVGIKVRSNRPKAVVPAIPTEQANEADKDGEHSVGVESPAPEFDPIADELPYIQLLNRVLPPDIRVLAWCPAPSPDFSARFNCKERRYRYFFTNPAYMPLPGSRPDKRRGPEDGWLDVEAMNEAAKKYEGLHDFRNLCKIDASKQITNFERRIFHAGIHKVEPSLETSDDNQAIPSPQLYWFEVRGSAFLWHQVRHLVAVLFLVGQGYEEPSIVDDLLDMQKTPARPVYEMASDIPLVLWDCIFPNAEGLASADHADGEKNPSGYHDSMEWIYVGDERGGRDQSKRALIAVEDGKHGRNGIMEELWALWRQRKMDEVLASSLMSVVSTQGGKLEPTHVEARLDSERSARLFDGSEFPRTIGKYVKVANRERLETPDVVNARYALRKGLDSNGRRPSNSAVDADE
ncbi:related to pseudouridine synthase 3 [Ramularia collo-cygni]|uniref:Related to pseudouridine synthase 3 n=1 Tax=Ramularia collo-cygni TaxID=112498 RepID=A0A2D3VBL1_9PEZI|nr:related to pseudouridine synthase 3 [Ramularia collo-cygni]CZT21076.1 related to pseudouridine synthase 3 [Ramularia collo-cygni]